MAFKLPFGKGREQGSVAPQAPVSQTQVDLRGRVPGTLAEQLGSNQDNHALAARVTEGSSRRDRWVGTSGTNGSLTPGKGIDMNTGEIL